ncbi:MAG: hypothetical protein E7670_01735 [Ruminococcaceae bacterium]|nr:hypothetical protein [Oscillospiraceae bacterium]
MTNKKNNDKIKLSDGKYAVGNPIRMWEDGFDMYGYALEWEGRQLVSVGSVSDYTDVATFLEYTYNADGIRTSKTYNGVKHEYFLNGSQVLAETWTENNVEHLFRMIGGFIDEENF